MSQVSFSLRALFGEDVIGIGLLSLDLHPRPCDFEPFCCPAAGLQFRHTTPPSHAFYF
jgi:hypothetical protein